VFIGFDTSNPVPITLPYSFFYNLKPKLFEDLQKKEQKGEVEVEKETEISIATKRLYEFYKNKGRFNGFSEGEEWYYLYQLKSVVVFILYNDENYKSEIDSNPLDILEDFPKLKYGISLCSYHSDFEVKKVDKLQEEEEKKKEEKKKEEKQESFEMIGQHFMTAPLGAKCYTIANDNYLKNALNNIFLNDENPLTPEFKDKIRRDYKESFRKVATINTDIADKKEFNIPVETPTHSQQESINTEVETRRHQASTLNSLSKNSHLAYKQVTKFVAASKMYYGSHKEDPFYMWGTFSYPVFDESFLPYLNDCLTIPKTTKKEYDKLIESSIFLFDYDDGYIFKLQKEYGETRIPFTYEIFKHFVRQYGDEKLKKLFCCLFWNRTAEDYNKILDDYIIPATIVHQLLSLVYDDYKLLDTSCNHNLDNPDIPLEDYIPYTLSSAANTQDYDSLPEVSYKRSFLETVNEDEEDSPFSPGKKPADNPEEKGGTRKRNKKKGNKNNKKTRKMKKITKKIKKRTKKTKKLKKLK
jgi:hypothetical protein